MLLLLLNKISAPNVYPITSSRFVQVQGTELWAEYKSICSLLCLIFHSLSHVIISEYQFDTPNAVELSHPLAH